ncbi:MAG: 23S rRNA (adenine(2030)-N(6))-methyltransferase RlmJ [Gammaproteobacteria bacterium]|nr:23S rRNA (adenine(2030)-N(6))-methyltransferase RlmJ [Gammaproteobacteria bacterium]
MLSYRHGFHAGNHADVLKHCVLMSVLEYMLQKITPFVYVDTHAGAGMYSLQDDWAEKTRDYETGISRLWQQSGSPDMPPALQAYLQKIHELNPGGELQQYPGSPWIAQAMLRKHDRARLFELHPNEYKNLHELFARNKHFKHEQRDGFQGLNEVMPPIERRAVTLIDPSYEVKADYQTVVQSVKAAHKKFNSGVYLIWYPVINRKQVDQFEQDFINSGMKNILLAELSLYPDTDHAGMTGSGMVVVNPPWLLAESLQVTLPYLQKVLAEGKGSWRIRQLVAE